MSREVAIEIKNLSKVYSLYKKPSDRLKEQLLNKTYSNQVHALNDANVIIYKGETFGIIGENGSGKSTLLQILASIIRPTSGQMTVNGKVAALLELGSGFNPEYTGRENIYLNASVLGMNRDEINERIHKIIEFSEIEDFIDRPVKTYSSGMFLRLAFSVAINVEADILLIDEALAVGDVFFRQKCYKRLNELRAKGVTIIFVSHAMGEVEQFCERSLLLEHGNSLFLGTTREAVKRYYLIRQEKKDINLPQQTNIKEERKNIKCLDMPEEQAFYDISENEQVTNGYAKCVRVALADEYGQFKRVFKMRDKAVFYYEFLMEEDIEVPVGGTVIYNEKNIIVHGKNSLQYNDINIPRCIKKGEHIIFKQEIDLNLQEGDYTFEIGIASMTNETYENKGLISHHELDHLTQRHCHISCVGNFSIILNSNGENNQLWHHGIADLPSNCKIVRTEG